MHAELVTTPSFHNDLWKIPQKEQKKFTYALKQINVDPFRGGGNTKKIFKHRYNNVYRYRIGRKYRVIYCVGNKCIKLLMVGNRNEIYQRFEADPDGHVETPEGLVGAEPQAIQTTHFDPPRIVEPVDGEDIPDTETEGAVPKEVDSSEKLLIELLQEWGIWEDDRKAILKCSSIEDILELDIDDKFKELVLHWKWPTKINEVIEEPVYELPKVEYIEEYLAGTLKGFLLKLDPEQEKVAKKHLKGPTLVKGGPGTGKSLVALYRIRNLMQPDAQKDLFHDTLPTILFVTYTTTLIRASQQLLEPLLQESMDHVNVNNLDKIVRMIMGRADMDFRPATENHKAGALKQAVDNFQVDEPESAALGKLKWRVSNDYLIDEFDWVIEGREIKDLDRYLEEDRSGRGIRFDVTTRKIVWDLYKRYLTCLENMGRQTWNQLRSSALAAVLTGEVSVSKYDVVIVDEAQDLTPVGLRLCMALCKTPPGFYMTADSGQSIYNRGFSWKRVDETINVRGKTTILKYNYRSTRQIMEASLQPLRDSGGGDPDTANLIPILEGPKPTIFPCSGVDDQVKKTAEFFKRSAEELRLPISAGAVFVRSNKAGEEFAQLLTGTGINAELVKGDTFDLDKKVVKVMTIHSAKGLEFPFAALVRVDANQIPMLWNINDEDERESRLADERRLLCVGLSRAMRRLALLYDQYRPSCFLREIDQNNLWV